jgi:hypothetical protein
VAQGVGPEFKPQCHKKRKKEKIVTGSKVLYYQGFFLKHKYSLNKSVLKFT